jgi:hypothetical protein
MALATSSVSLIGAWAACLGTASSHLVPHQGAESRGPVALDCGIARATFGDAHRGPEVEQRKPNRAHPPRMACHTAAQWSGARHRLRANSNSLTERGRGSPAGRNSLP